MAALRPHDPPRPNLCPGAAASPPHTPTSERERGSPVTRRADKRPKATTDLMAACFPEWNPGGTECVAMGTGACTGGVWHVQGKWQASINGQVVMS